MTSADVERAFQAIAEFLPMGLPIVAIIGGIAMAFSLSQFIIREIERAWSPDQKSKYESEFGPFDEKEKPKNSAAFDPFADDELPTYMTVGDDGELVEVERE